MFSKQVYNSRVKSRLLIAATEMGRLDFCCMFTNVIFGKVHMKYSFICFNALLQGSMGSKLMPHSVNVLGKLLSDTVTHTCFQLLQRPSFHRLSCYFCRFVFPIFLVRFSNCVPFMLYLCCHPSTNNCLQILSVS